MTAEPFALLVPVKTLAEAKTRLALDPSTTRRLMRAFARDAVAAAVQSPVVAAVFVVAGDADVVDQAGTEVLPDEGDGDLNRALVAAERRARSLRPGLGVAALCADLPCLTESDLTAALTGHAASRWFVADAAGTGTTLLAAGASTALQPLFGAGSAGRHAASGAVAVADELATLRLDVDTTEDLERAVGLGVGAHTAEALAPCW